MITFLQDCFWPVEPCVCHRRRNTGPGDYQGCVPEGSTQQQLFLLLHSGWCWCCWMYWTLVWLVDGWNWGRVSKLEWEFVGINPTFLQSKEREFHNLKASITFQQTFIRLPMEKYISEVVKCSKWLITPYCLSPLGLPRYCICRRNTFNVLYQGCCFWM